MKYQGKSEWWEGIGENKTGIKYCRNCGRPPIQGGYIMENPYTGERLQWLPPFCPHCGADMYGKNKSNDKDKWIRCEDRLPEWWETEEGYVDSTPVLVFYEETDDAIHQMAVGEYVGRWEVYDDYAPLKDPIAWMPLPEPYKETDTESDEQRYSRKDWKPTCNRFLSQSRVKYQ